MKKNCSILEGDIAEVQEVNDGLDAEINEVLEKLPYDSLTKQWKLYETELALISAQENDIVSIVAIVHARTLRGS